MGARVGVSNAGKFSIVFGPIAPLPLTCIPSPREGGNDFEIGSSYSGYIFAPSR